MWVGVGVGVHCICVFGMMCIQEPSDEEVREKLIRKHFTNRISVVKAEVYLYYCYHVFVHTSMYYCLFHRYKK